MTASCELRMCLGETMRSSHEEYILTSTRVEDAEVVSRDPGRVFRNDQVLGSAWCNENGSLDTFRAVFISSVTGQPCEITLSFF